MARIKLALGLVLFTLLVYGQLINLDRPGSNLPRFGWEYGNIAQSLATQGTFADAMGPGGGPTAWMPPVLPCIYALGFLLCGVRSHEAVLFLLTVKSFCLACCFVVFLHIVHERWGRGGLLAAAVLTGAWLILEDYRVCGEFDDSWLVTCASLLSLWALLRLQRGDFNWRIGAVSFFLPLACPTLTLGYAVCAALLGLGLWRRRESPRRYVWTLGLIVCAALAWSVRNQAVLGRFYPVKSNLWFDLVEANLWDDDGILTDSIFMAFHPINRGLVQDRYNDLGEVRFLDEARNEAHGLAPEEWLRRCSNRLFNATVRLQGEMDFQRATGLRRQDVPVLEEHLWMRRVGEVPHWMFLFRQEKPFREALLDMPLVDRKAVLRSRQAAVLELQQRYATPAAWWWQYHFTFLPTVACFLILLRGNAEGRTAVLLYGCYLLPYLLVQHYCRYQLSVNWLQAFLLLQALAPQRIQLTSSQLEV